jgi:hypothetical protein
MRTRWKPHVCSPLAAGQATRHGGQHLERGAVTIFVAVALVGLLAMAGLAVDGGAKVRAAQRADRLAAEAARAAGQAIDLNGLLQGGPVTVDRRQALAAASRYLDDAGVEGSVELLEGGAVLRVTTSSSERTVFLALIGIARLEVTGQAEVRLTTQREGA